MVEKQQTDSAWKVQKRLQLIARRYDFPDYDETRSFLDRLEDLSESESYYPDLTFSRTHVSVSIKARDEKLAQIDFDFSEKVDALLNETSQQDLTGKNDD